MSFNYVFASTEYPNDPTNPTGSYVNSWFNDAFGFYLSGPGISGPYENNAINIAGVPDGTGGLFPITVSSVNGVLNTEFFEENTDNDPICSEGYTIPLAASYNELECGLEYHIKLAIGDGEDDLLNSYIILESESFESNAVVDIDLSIDVGADVDNDPPILYEDCGTATLTFSRPEITTLEVAESIEIEYGGSAEYGVDYTALPAIITFEPYQTEVEIELEAFVDGDIEGVEIVTMQILNLAACNGGGLTSYFEFEISDTAEPLEVDGFSTSLCEGDSVLFQPVISGGYGNFIFDWECNPGMDTNQTSFVAESAGVFECILTVLDTCGMPSDTALFAVEVEAYPELTVDILGGDVELDCNGFEQVVAEAAGGNPPYEYSWEFQNGIPAFGYGNSLSFGTWSNASEVHVIVEDACGFTATSMINVSIDVPELIVDLDDEYEVECNVPFSITPEWSGGEPFYFWTWLDGFSPLGYSETLNWTTDQNLSITLEVSDGCGQVVTATTDVVVLSPALDVTLPDTLIGPCTETFTLSPGVDGGSGVYTYQWTQNFNPVGDGATYQYSDGLPTTFAVQVTDNCQATGSASTAILIDNPPLVVGMTDTINASCIDNTVIAVDILSGAGGYVYDWSVGGLPYGGSDPQITVQSLVTTPIQVEVEDGCGGESVASSILVIPDIPMSLTVSNDTVICRGESLTLSAEASGGEGGLVYSWPTIPAFGESQYVSPSMSVSFPIEVSDICGETLSETVNVEVQYVYSDFYTSYLTDTEIEFIATPEPECLTCDFQWDFGDGTTSEDRDPIHEYDGLGDYYAQLTVTNPLGCTDSAYTLVEGPVLIYIPNAFTPNNDGINDAFRVVISEVTRYELDIFNRWGELVFHSEDPSEVWIGNVEGGEYYAPAGMYNYRLKWKGLRTDAEEMLGTFQLMR